MSLDTKQRLDQRADDKATLTQIRAGHDRCLCGHERAGHNPCTAAGCSVAWCHVPACGCMVFRPDPRYAR